MSGIDRKFPGEFNFHGEAYLVSELRQTLSSICGIFFVVLLVFAFAGGFFLSPKAAEWVSDNRMALVFACMACNIASGQLLSSGAFEVEVNGELVFSKLAEGDMIEFPDLADRIGAALRAIKN